MAIKIGSHFFLLINKKKRVSEKNFYYHKGRKVLFAKKRKVFDINYQYFACLAVEKITLIIRNKIINGDVLPLLLLPAFYVEYLSGVPQVHKLNKVSKVYSLY